MQSCSTDIRPDPSCPDGEPGPEVGEGQTRLNVARVVDGCLAFSSEVVDAADVEEELADLRAEPDVVAADRAALYTPLGLDRRWRADDVEVEQWPLEERHLNGPAVRDLWPADEEVVVAVIDTGIDDTNPDLAGHVVEKVPWARTYEGSHDDHGTHVAGSRSLGGTDPPTVASSVRRPRGRRCTPRRATSPGTVPSCGSGRGLVAPSR